MATGPSGVELSIGFFPLGWFLFFCTPRIEIDGYVDKRPWGTYFIELTPGPHRVKIYFAYMGMAECGANSVDINVTPGTYVKVSYYMWPWMFSPGQMTVSQ